MASRSRRSSEKSADQHVVRIRSLSAMPTGCPDATRRTTCTSKTRAKATLPSYCGEDSYSSKVLTGNWTERRAIAALPKVPFKDAFMYNQGQQDTTKYQSAYKRTFIRDGLFQEAPASYAETRDKYLKNQKTFKNEAPDDVHHPEKGTPLHDRGAAWHSLYHQSYSLKNPKSTPSALLDSSIGAPEINWGLWDKHVKKWAKIDAEAAIEWKSMYQTGFLQPKDNDFTEERKTRPSGWRRQEGNFVIGNPHVLEAEKEQECPVSINRGGCRRVDKVPRTKPMK